MLAPRCILEIQQNRTCLNQAYTLMYGQELLLLVLLIIFGTVLSSIFLEKIVLIP